METDRRDNSRSLMQPLMLTFRSSQLEARCEVGRCHPLGSRLSARTAGSDQGAWGIIGGCCLLQRPQVQAAPGLKPAAAGRPELHRGRLHLVRMGTRHLWAAWLVQGPCPTAAAVALTACSHTQSHPAHEAAVDFCLAARLLFPTGRSP